MDKHELKNRFDYHAPDEAKLKTHEEIRLRCTILALKLDDLLPEGREKSLAMTHLEETMFWANAAIARNQ